MKDESVEVDEVRYYTDTNLENKKPSILVTSVDVPPHLRTYYCVQSITEYVGQTAKYEVKYKINNKARTLIWIATEDMINQFVAPDFINRGLGDGHKPAFLDLLWELIWERLCKLYPGYLAPIPTPTFDGLSRMKFLNENPEYRKTPLPPPPDEDFEVIGNAISDENSLAIVDNRFKTVPEYLSDPGGIGVEGLVDKIFPDYKLLLRAWSRCLWCFACCDCKKFNPPIKSDEVYDYVTPYDKCQNFECQNPNPVRIEGKSVPAFDIDTIHPSVPNRRLRICGVRNFAVQKGDIVRARGELQYTDTGIQFRCHSLEVIRLEKESKRADLEPTESDLQLKARKLAHKKCKDKWLQEESAIPKDDLINELCSEHPEVKSVFVNESGKLELRLRYNTRLKNFLDYMVRSQPDDDGRIEKIGTGGGSLRFLWQPNKDTVTIDITPKELPDKEPEE